MFSYILQYGPHPHMHNIVPCMHIQFIACKFFISAESCNLVHVHAVADPGGFQGFHGNPLLKFIYSNRAVGLRCSNYSSFIRNHPVINVNTANPFFWSSIQLKLSWRFCKAETETLFQKSWIRHWHGLS